MAHPPAAAQVDSMKPGSVVVDLAAEAGGNCEYTAPNAVQKTPSGVTVIGYTDLPSRCAPACLCCLPFTRAARPLRPPAPPGSPPRPHLPPSTPARPPRLPTQSSTLYSNNISKFLLSMGPFSTGNKGVFLIDDKDDAVRGALVLEQGQLRWPAPPLPAPAAPPGGWPRRAARLAR